jgi:hypothetical protein
VETVERQEGGERIIIAIPPRGEGEVTAIMESTGEEIRIVAKWADPLSTDESDWLVAGFQLAIAKAASAANHLALVASR